MRTAMRVLRQQQDHAARGEYEQRADLRLLHLRPAAINQQQRTAERFGSCAAVVALKHVQLLTAEFLRERGPLGPAGEHVECRMGVAMLR